MGVVDNRKVAGEELRIEDTLANGICVTSLFVNISPPTGTLFQFKLFDCLAFISSTSLENERAFSIGESCTFEMNEEGVEVWVDVAAGCIMPTDAVTVFRFGIEVKVKVEVRDVGGLERFVVSG